ncbi:MAG: hypothetical protein HC880_12770 [Bacteroidia bacterium]|nr:hypothetical protein [Bacteroidia bacterium]
MNSYKEILAKPYLTDQQTLDYLVREAYDRMQQEVKVRHILLNLPEDAAPEDTMAAYQKMKTLYEQALAGEDFKNLTLTHSQDPSVKTNEGVIGYFTALQMVYPFENTAYNTPVGEISDIFRTRYGYHILEVLDRRPSHGTLQVAHIMVQIPQQASEAQTREARQKLMKYTKNFKKVPSGIASLRNTRMMPPPEIRVGFCRNLPSDGPCPNLKKQPLPSKT